MASSAPNPAFETTFITKPAMADEALKVLQDRVYGVVQAYGGELVMTEDWGQRKLAYPIAKETRGRYSYFAYTGRSDVVAEIERTLRLQDTVMRFLTVNLGKDFEAEKFKKLRVDTIAAAKKREEERVARREERAAERRGGYGGGYGGGGGYDRGDRGGFDEERGGGRERGGEEE